MKKNKMMLRKGLAVLLAMGLFSTTAFAAETTTEKMEPMTYEKAVELATKNNTSLTDLSEKMNYLSENKSDLVKSGETGMRPGNEGELVIMDSVRLGRLSAMNGISTTLEISNLTKEVTSQVVVASVKSSLADIKLGQENLSVMESALAQQRQSLAYARVKASLGMLSSNQLKTMEAETVQMEQNKNQMAYNLEKAYTDFNYVLGLSSEKRYDVDYQVEVTPVKLDTNSIETHIDRALGQDASLKIAKAQMDSAGFSYLTMSDSSTVADYRAAEFSIAESERAYADAKKSKKNAMRTAYIQLQQMEATQKTLEADLEKAQMNYDQALVNYQVGNIAKLTLEQAQLGLERAKVDMEKNQYDYDVLKYTFEHPSLVGGSK